jgi:hypothetical protein
MPPVVMARRVRANEHTSEHTGKGSYRGRVHTDPQQSLLGVASGPRR